MPLHLIKHALIGHLVARLREQSTTPLEYRRLTDCLTRLLLAEATRELETEIVSVQTPLEMTECRRLKRETVAVPILRAGLGMVNAVMEMLPDSTVGYLGMERNEQTAIASSYYAKLPPIEGRVVFLLDPMLATGGSAEQALRRIFKEMPHEIHLLCIVSAPEGADRLTTQFPGLQIWTAALDRELNASKYILPGLGDFGDRLYGTL